ncbi:chitin disaccharide deacetylase [Photobacterium nomapromontoriensis]|uniref:chitin disaccharide deacetylase n=1 Tax=Photobacterium nomapromontoriensis TaxID=2910237 RepID=UPI003D12DE0C
MHVIFNADDFGLTPGVNLGIIAASQTGVVRSTTLMVGMEADKQAIDLAKLNPSLSVGLHLRFTAGISLTAAPSLTDKNGRFFTYKVFDQMRGLCERQIADEIIAQIDYFLATGIPLSHIDSHHHAHTHPQILPVVKEIARDYHLPLRDYGYPASARKHTKYHFNSDFYGEDISIDTIVGIINQHQNDTDILEIMCHPAYIDQCLLDTSNYNLPRAKELAILTDKGLITQLDMMGVTLGDYSIFSD